MRGGQRKKQRKKRRLSKTELQVYEKEGERKEGFKR
jgi:hypothetical protein